MIWRCVICFVFVALTLKSLLSHINSAHSRTPDFRVVCGIDGCAKEYRVYNSLWYHIRRNHREHLENGSSKITSQGTTATSSREASSPVNRNVWAYRPAMMGNRQHGTDEAVVENELPTENTMTAGIREQPRPCSVSPQHFGAFDRAASLYSGFDGGICSSPNHPAFSQTVVDTLNTTVNTQDGPFPAVVNSSASKVILPILVHNYI